MLPAEFICIIQMLQQVFCMKNAYYFIKIVFINGNTAVMQLLQAFHHFLKRHFVFYAAYIKS